MRKAVEGADLAAGVRGIMVHEQEDHCADTRLVCLVENLPAERLAELPALLNQYQANDFVLKFLSGSCAKRDPAAALAWVEGQGTSARGSQLRSALVEGMSEPIPPERWR